MDGGLKISPVIVEPVYHELLPTQNVSSTLLSVEVCGLEISPLLEIYTFLATFYLLEILRILYISPSPPA